MLTKMAYSNSKLKNKLTKEKEPVVWADAEELWGAVVKRIPRKLFTLIRVGC